MFDDLKEWLSDHLRYILILLGVLLLAVVIFIALHALSGLGSRKGSGSGEKETSDEVIVGDAGKTEDAQAETVDLQNVTLTQNDNAVLPTVQQYYQAKGNKDMDALNVVVESLSEDTKEEIESDTWNEGYENVSTYSVPGLTDKSYVVYVAFDEKLVDIETPAPSLEVLYVKECSDGSLRIADPGDDRSVVNYINQLNSSDAVQALVSEVTERYTEVERTEPALASLMAKLSEQETELQFDEVPETLEGAGSVDSSLLEATAVCNVRSEPNENSTVYGMLDIGSQVTCLESLDSGWTKIEYHGLEAYVSSQFLQPVVANGAQSDGAQETTVTDAGTTGTDSGEQPAVVDNQAAAVIA